ncbi:hypothetical protein D0C36_21690 [Mucilaginibacter conchicola]|uniref:DUF4062 domain-containing protein n=1 Tax=Mucilaginibacter conchicola TaxID=2303333 RepID=A0A372NNG2_9SPHI|nr:hypothetical protein [Mucilaginibacter conchicola]RFZ90408.1 hypothetical protein D0C36_21690 [Mucilaginibacter conchicola]
MKVELIKCFLASPSDTVTERDICEKVFNDINRGIGKSLGVRLESLRWEFDSYPSFKGEYSQQIISNQLGDNYSLFIGLMFMKFGTQTRNANSGTEEEFDIAYRKMQADNDVDIMFYFNDSFSGSCGDIDLDSVAKIRSFKKKIQELDGYYWSYRGSNDFENVFRHHITLWLTEKFSASTENVNSEKKDFLKDVFEKRLRDALSTFDSQPIVWVEPILSTTDDISVDPNENFERRVPVDSLLVNTKSTVITAAPQFGLTCLSHYLVKKAWELNKLWIYIDCQKYKPHNIHNAISRELEALNIELKDFECLVLDEWTLSTSNVKMLKHFIDKHPEKPIVLMSTVDDSKFFNDDVDIDIEREFDKLYLLALPRQRIRDMISQYNKLKPIGEENLVLSKVTTDLEVLNIHRTPLNCLTLLKVSEKYFDESPVNRTAMLELVLFVLFNTDGIPNYKSKPDVKDCEFVLGKFCERLMKDDAYEFTRDKFISELKDFCASVLLYLDVDVVFDVLFSNNIIVQKSSKFSFKSSYWIFYFAAKRMHIDAEFCEYVFSTKKHIAFPEITEFYTGIDRNRRNAVEILTNDLINNCNTVIEKVGIQKDVNPLALIEWRPTEEQVEKAQNEMNDIVQTSSLPEAIKDQYADKNYNQIKPYDQSIQTFLEEYSVVKLMQNIKASARALRNSDYVSPDLKKKMLKEILRGWDQISNILFAISPLMAAKGEAKVEGASFVLAGDFGESFEERITKIFQVIPANVVGFFKDDIFSTKIAPLLYDEFKNEVKPLKKHHLALLIIYTRPIHWEKEIENYIVSLHKNTFYLFNIVNTFKAKLKFDFINDEDARKLEYLFKMGLAKHEFGDRKPSNQTINKIPRSVIPKRETDD